MAKPLFGGSRRLGASAAPEAPIGPGDRPKPRQRTATTAVGGRGIAVMRQLAALLGPQIAWPVAGGILLIVCSAGLSVISPLALRDAVNHVTNRNLAAAELAIVAYAGAAGATRVMQSILVWIEGSLWRRMQRSLLQRLYQHILELPHSFHAGRRTGELGRIVSDGLSGSRSVVSALMFSTLPVLFQVAAISVILSGLGHHEFLVVLLAFAAIYGIVFRHGTLRQWQIQRAAAIADAQAAGTATDAMLNFETVKLFTGEERVLGQIDAELDRSQSAWRVFFRVRTVNGLILSGVFTAALLTILLVAARQVPLGTMSVGDFVLANAYVMQIILPIERLGVASRQLTQGLVFVDRMLELLRDGPPAPFRAGRRIVKGSGPLAVSADALCFGYAPGAPVLRDISLDIAPGETVGIVGPSGAGKSTLSRLLFRFYEPTSGRILINGVPIEEIDLAGLRQMIAIVPQNTVLFNGSILHNLLFARPEATPGELEAAASIAGVDGVVATLPDGWSTIVGEQGLRLSGGEKQRVAIARAILKRPRLLILDEATSSLDAQAEQLIQRAVARAYAGVTTLIVAHRLSAVRNADKILFLKDGSVVESGRHDILMAAKGHYAAMWAAQQMEQDDGATRSGPDHGVGADTSRRDSPRSRG